MIGRQTALLVLHFLEKIILENIKNSLKCHKNWSKNLKIHNFLVYFLTNRRCRYSCHFIIIHGYRNLKIIFSIIDLNI